VTDWKRKDLLGLEDLSVSEIETILNLASSCKQIYSRQIKKFPTLRGKTVVLLFFEPSTRTRTSFEIASKWMSADLVNISVAQSSVVKGESLYDTVHTIEAMGPDLVVIRHRASGVPQALSQRLACSVINAGDGAHEHPTQALLDLYTIQERFGRIKGLNVLIVGDILHSRVARSQIYGLKKMGATVTLIGPSTLMPKGIESFGVRIGKSLDEELPKADVVSLLRIQKERQQSGLFPSLEEYAELFGIGQKRLELIRDDALIIHPGPTNLGVEISLEASEDRRSAINQQVTNGVAVRMAALYLLLGGGGLDREIAL
jgi:aspartate carbamoyltransferase catalytic subunit